MPLPDPVRFPVLDPETGTLVEVPHWSVGAVAAMFHIGETTVRRRIKTGEWAALEPLTGSYWMNAEQVDAAYRSMTHGGDGPAPAVPEAEGPPRLGIPVSDSDLEGMR